MSAPLVPSPLDYVGPRRFAFYPAILKAGPNEWFLCGGAWTEVQVVNARTGSQVWVPRRYVGGVSDAAGLILVVELTKELTLGNDGVAPVIKRVIEMPRIGYAADMPLGKKIQGGPANVVGIRPANIGNSRARILAKAGLAAVVLCVLAAIVTVLVRL